MRNIPNDIAFAAMPDDFEIEITDDGRTLRSEATINGNKYELGLRPERTAEQIGAARKHLRIGMWQIHEFVRLDRLDLAAYAHSARHTKRR